MKPSSPARPATRILQGQASWRLASAEVEAFVTEMGGHLGPVTFDRRGKRIQPYSVAPWAEEPADRSLPPIIRALRGDFFCLPFGGNATAYRGERHPVHGETANARWRLESLERKAGRACLHLSLRTKIRPGRVDKRLWLIDGQNVVYSQHTVAGMSGPMSFGHHAMLRFPDVQGCGRVSTSPFVYGQVFPHAFEFPEKGGYSWLKLGAGFKSLEQVPTLDGRTADLTRYPARRGFEDLVMLVSDSKQRFAWTAVAFPEQGYAWFALKDPCILRQTVLWISNAGRHYPPWSSRHVNVMGLEEVCSYFHTGLAESARPNPVSAKGFPTCRLLDPRKPLVVPYIMGVARIPRGFDRVEAIKAAGDRCGVTLQSASGKSVHVPVHLEFLQAEAGW